MGCGTLEVADIDCKLHKFSSTSLVFLLRLIGDLENYVDVVLNLARKTDFIRENNFFSFRATQSRSSRQYFSKYSTHNLEKALALEISSLNFQIIWPSLGSKRNLLS